MSKIHTIRQKHYPKDSSMEGVFREFYLLENTIEKSEHSLSNIDQQVTRRYAVARLVTVIEQFFHAVLIKKISKNPAEHDHHTIRIHKALLADAIRHAEYNWHSTYPKDVEEQICRFLDSDESNETESEHCRLDKDRLANLLEPYCHAQVSDLWHLFIANEHSFQNTHRILEEIGKHEIVVFDDSDAELSVKNYDRLFNLRHVLMHTLNAVDINIKRYMKPTMRLFKRVLKNAGYDDSHIAFICGFALNEAGRHEEAISALESIADTPAGIVFQTLGAAHYAKGDAVSGKKSLMIALYVANDIHGMFGTRSRPRGTAYASKAKLSSVWINNALLYRAIGETFRINGERDLAIRCFETALIQCPSYTLLQEDIGGTFVGMGMNERAGVCFKKVVSAEPTNIYALNQLGIIYGVSDPKKSKIYFKRILKLEPENKLAKRGLEALANGQ